MSLGEVIVVVVVIAMSICAREGWKASGDDADG